MQTLPLRWQNWRRRPTASEPPLRAELFTVEQLARHAETLANSHEVAAGLGASDLLGRLAVNEQRLRAFNRATLRVNSSRRITPAAEWLLDNFYLIDEQIQLARRHLPKGYSRELPHLVHGPSAGLPRVYDLMLELIPHVDAQIDAASLSAFVAAYQRTTPLTLGELWAIPIMLRLGVIENLQRVTAWLTVARHDRDLADEWVDRLQATAEKNPSGLIIVVADMARAAPPLSSSFVAEFCQRLSRKNPVLHLARNWLEQRLAERGQSIEELIQRETQAQAADQVSVSNSIASLRFLGALDWKDFVEALSVVEQILGSDPAGVYRRMDFATRDRYRHAVETFARYSRTPEGDVARQAVQLATDAARNRGANDRTAHVGYYLIDAGRPALETATAVVWPARMRFERAIRRHPLAFYPGGITALTLLASGIFFRELPHFASGRAAALVLTGLFAVGFSQLAVALANWLTAVFIQPRLLPRIDYATGILPADRTIVVVPTLLGSEEGVDRLVESLEVYQLANRDPQLQFALLTDFRDAEAEFLPEDEPLVQRARGAIEQLNEKYPGDAYDRFLLLHRPRRWNAGENHWMGHERKRGKLEDLNILLRTGSREAFSVIEGRTGSLAEIRYVITLDTDTQLPRGVAQKLAGTMAHPLNRPEIDNPARGIVTSGYAILQPRVGLSMTGADRSWFTRLFAGDAGIDPYTRAISDVYQDLFDEGSFIGKGIYDVDAFERSLGRRFPENTVLSHDLLEGCYARSGLVTDVEVYEDYPFRYNVDMARRHRWIRGDWQISPWLLSRVPSPGAASRPNVLSGLSQWKIFDNLRRSLVPVALLLLLLGGWWRDRGLLGDCVTWWTLAITFIPGLVSIGGEAARKPRELPWRVHLGRMAKVGGRHVIQCALGLAFLPYDAWVSLDASGRSLLRLLVTRRNLLEWQTSGDSAKAARTGLGSFYRAMWPAPVAAVAIAFWRRQRGPRPPALLAGLWLMAPAIAWWISRPLEPAKSELTAKQRTFLRRQARKTWLFFETFVTAEENWLPPDNFQEVPSPRIASRTSPTNIGLALLANLAANDFGYIPLSRLLRRTEDTLATMGRLERYRGHFFNWYDTRTREPLLPRYISTVDSGNLAGHLLILSSGLRMLPDALIAGPKILEALRDTAGIVRQQLGGSTILTELDATLAATPRTLMEMVDCLAAAREQAERLAAELAEQPEELKNWGGALRRDSAAHLEDLRALAPWATGPDWFRLRAGVPAEKITALRSQLERIPSLCEVAELEQALGPVIDQLSRELPAEASADRAWLADLRRRVEEGSATARQRLLGLEELARQSDEFTAMDFTFLSDPARKLFWIGYNLTDRRRDSGFFDLLASESRLGTYVAIAQGQVSQDFWFAMSRLLVAVGGEPILVSWSGSMFEYLMPELVMPSYPGSLLNHTRRMAVKRQIEYGRAQGVAWGVSESGYYRTDADQNYQYRAFGVPGLGLKRGLSEDLVVAPYATVMALVEEPRGACENLQRLVREGCEGTYGFYEAVDHTASRLPPGQSSVIIRSFMAHHEGMSLLALLQVLCGELMQQRFLACPLLKSADLLLQERIPHAMANVFTDEVELDKRPNTPPEDDSTLRVFTTPAPRTPEVHLLSNGRYHVVITSAGGGYSRWHDLAVTRWREDATRDCWGTFLYLRDTATGEFWSAAHQPALRPAKRYEAIFTQARAEFRQRQADLEIHTQVCISPEDDVELRRVTLTNHSSSVRRIEMTSYAEVVLALPGADAAHPAFSNLFVQTEFIRGSSALLATRRARSQDEKPPWMVNLLVGPNLPPGELSCETDRSAFVGRGRTLASPAAMQASSPLGGGVGSVLDPIVALRRVITVAPNESTVVDLLIGMAESREAALALVEKYQSSRMADRALDLAWTHSQVILRQLNANEADAQLYARLASALIYADATRRAGAAVLAGNRRGQSGLWSYGISGDAPIVLLRITDGANLGLVRQLVQAHSYWRMKGLTVELLIINEDASVYRQSLNDQIVQVIAAGIEAQMLDKPGGIVVRRLEQIPHDDRILLQSAARIVLDDEHGTLEEQLDQRVPREPVTPALVPTRSVASDPPVALPPRELIFSNSLGGFTRDGHEYIITLENGRTTPAPWVNVLANPYFGTVVTESGGAYTWLENAHEFRLTPWQNDPVQDSSGELFYIRDEQTGQFWSPTPLPARGANPYVIRHGFGYSVFEHTEHGIASELWVYVAMDAPVKFNVLKLRNVSGRPRRLSVFGYWEWVLGEQRAQTLLHVQTEVDRKTGALLARNYYSAEFPDRIAFVDVSDATRTLTADRREFFGRNGTFAQPAALKRTRLSGRVGAGLDPCGALQVTFDLSPGQERETTFRLGAGRSPVDVQNLIERFRRSDASRRALEAVWA